MTAINDKGLHGNCLTVPLKLSVQAFRYTFSAWPENLSSSQKASEVFKRAALLIASIGAIPSLPFAIVGVAVKWIDLGLRINQLVHKGPAISYHLPMLLEIYSRLGDRTVAYLNTKFVAEKYRLPVYFISFKGCENFQFSQDEKLTSPQYFKKVVHLKSAKEIGALKDVGADESTLYLLPFFPHIRHTNEETPRCGYIKNYTTNWRSFKGRVGELLKVIKPHTSIDIPQDRYSIALHIRDGGNYDDDKTKTLHPLKLPPINFYLGELRRVLDAKLNEPVFVHIFTDAVDPEKIRKQVADSLPQGRDIRLSYSQKSSLTNDIANMSRFQCMIRADSNLSGPISAGSKVLDLEIFPTHFKVDKQWKNISISRVRRVINGACVDIIRTDYPKKVVTGGLPICFFKKFHELCGIIQKE
jgi:hypothetical protein